MIEYTVGDNSYGQQHFLLGADKGTDLGTMAKAAAENYHYKRGGWEDSDWPKVFTIYRDGDIVGGMEVDREVVPEFTATELKL